MVLLLAAAVPLKHVRTASNLLILCGSVFIATQLVLIFRPAAHPVPDQQIGSTDTHFQSGHNIVIDVGGGRYLEMAHLSPGSIQVKVGDHVRVGQEIAKVGNSGNTSEPHLHIQAQTVGTGVGDVATMDIPTIVRTLHTYSLVFTDVVLTRRGAESAPVTADVRRGDLVRPS